MNDMDFYYFVYLIGCTTVVYLSFKFISSFWVLFHAYFLTAFGFTTDLRKYGEWVVVTGATDGIGKQYACQLAAQGFKIVLISRNETKLEKVAAEIVKEFNVEVKVICYDFTQTDGYGKIEADLRELDIGILVNNVAMVSPSMDIFHVLDIDYVQNTIHCNIFSDVQMTHVVSKGMAARQRGLIIHIASGVIFVNFPYISVYPATKAFMAKLFKSLRLEYSGVIDHQLVTPAYVSTNMSRKEPGFTIPSADDYVKSAIRTIGIMDTTCGYFSHEMQRVFLLFLPQWLLWFIFKQSVSRSMKKD